MSKKLLRLAAITAMFTLQGAVFAQVPAGYPADYQKIIDAAKKEGKLIIYSTTDSKAAEPLQKDFEALYPGIKIEYNDMNSTELVNRFISEQAARGGGTDVVWTSSMDSGLNIGVKYAAVYQSPEAKAIPQWANYKNKVYGTTFEPIVAVYNKNLVKGAQIPKNNNELGKIVSQNADTFRNKVTTYDIEKSAVGFMLAAQDSIHNPQYFDFIKNVGSAGLIVQSSVGTMLERVSSGENLMAYNVFASYAETRAKKDPSLGIIYANDYTLIMSRVTFINNKSKNPNAARLWIDYVLSDRGQNIIANKAELGSIRNDIQGDNDISGISKKIPGKVTPIPINDSILTFLDTTKRLAFIQKWRTAAGK